MKTTRYIFYNDEVRLDVENIFFEGFKIRQSGDCCKVSYFQE